LSGFAVASAPGRPTDFDAFAAGALGRTFATGPAFHRALLRHGPGWGGLTLGVRAGSDGQGPLVCALEGWIERRLGGAWLRAQPFGAPAGPLFSPGLGATERAAATRLLWTELDRVARAFGWIGGELTYAGPAALDPALRAPAALGTERSDIAHVIELAEGPEAWYASLRKRARQQLTKAERLGVTVEATADPADLDAVHAHHVGQLRAWGRRELRPLAFYRALLEPPAGARLWVARAEGAILCGVLVFVDPGEAYVWWSGSGLEARRRLAFPYLLSRVVAECGSARVNLGFSGREERLTDFKEQMGAAALAVPILDLLPRPRTPYHALLATVRDRARARRARRAPAPPETP
jgi:GNAT acetyltransferase-like protein